MARGGTEVAIAVAAAMTVMNFMLAEVWNEMKREKGKVKSNGVYIHRMYIWEGWKRWKNSDDERK